MRLGLREVAATVGATLAAFGAGCGTGVGAMASAERDCGQAVIADWTDGAIDRPYPDTCYLAAIDSLPEDVRAYTSAVADIQRAMMSARGKGSRLLAESFAREEPEAKPDEVPWVVAALGAFAVVVAAAGGTAFVVRRRRASA